MKTKALLAIALALGVSASSRAEQMSPAVCRHVIELGRAEFNHAWEVTWRNFELPMVRRALYSFVQRLSDPDREFIRAYEKGQIAEHVFAKYLYDLTGMKDHEGIQVPMENRVALNPSSQGGKWRFSVYGHIGHWSFENVEVDLSHGHLDRHAVDRAMQKLQVERVSKYLGTKRPVHTATEYIRFHLGLPDECFPGDKVPGFAKNDADAKGSSTGEALAVGPVPAAGSAGAAL